MSVVAALLLRTARNSCRTSTKRSRLECRCSERPPLKTSYRTEFPRLLPTWDVQASRSGSSPGTNKVRIAFCIILPSNCYFVVCPMLCICIGQNIKSRKRPSVRPASVCGQECDVIYGPVRRRGDTCPSHRLPNQEEVAAR